MDKFSGSAAFAKTIAALYTEGQTDYNMPPLVLTVADGAPLGRIRNGDAVIFSCRRGEREVQLTEAFTDPVFAPFPRPPLDSLEFVILTLYHEKFKHLPVAFAPEKCADTLGEVVSQAGLRQARIAEAEKFAHVTFFLNGGNNQPFPGEQDTRVPSPKGVPFEQVPALSLPEVSQKVIEALNAGVPLVVTNFANGDVIGHTSDTPAKLECARVVDEHLGAVIAAARQAGYVVMVTADHGNLEILESADGAPHVAHTTNPVAFIALGAQTGALRDGILADVAPTVLSALGVAQPASMTGATLAPEAAWGGARKVLLVILDGWGLGSADDNNPIHAAETPVWDALLREHPNSRLSASGEAVGLQSGKAGNSEAGHMNIGAGRVVAQDDVRLDSAMQDGSFAANPVFLRAIRGAKARGARLHLLALLSEKSSHGSMAYPLALAALARQENLPEVYIHMILDGRSTEPGSAPALLRKFEQQLSGAGQVVTVVGRGIALDRAGNYAKTRRAFDALVSGAGQLVTLD